MNTQVITDKTQGFKAKTKKLWSKWPFKAAAAVVAVALIFGTLVQLNVVKLRQAAGEKITQRIATAQKGSLSSTITSSGPVVSSNRAEITAYVNATVTKVHHKEGDEVKEGDLLFELDDSDAVLNIEKIQISIQQNQLTLNSNIDSLNNLYMPAPFSGLVSNIQAREGDTLNKNAPVLTLTDKSRLKLMVSFSGSNIGDIKAGQKASVNIPELMQSVEGTVSYVSSSSYSTASGGQLYNVEIEVSNPGSLEEGMKANAEIDTPSGAVSCTDSGTLSYINSMVVKSETGGLIKKVNVKENQYVGSGYSLLELEDDSVVIAKDSTELKIKDLQLQFESAQKQLENYKIYAPTDGVIVSQDINEGDVTKNGQVVCIVSNNNQMELTVSIDELDIAKIEVGMKTMLTVDALPETSGKPLEGKVSSIALEGNSSNGVTTYPVTISIDSPEGLLGGMNTNAEIYISNKEDALYIPIEAVQKMGDRSIVMVKADGQVPSGAGTGMRSGAGAGRNRADTEAGNESSSRPDGNATSRRNAAGGNGFMSGNASRADSQTASYYAGSVPRMVETGIVTDTYIEIVSGLNEGDEVVLPPLTASQSQNETKMPSGGFPMGGGMAGRMGSGGGMRR